MRSPRMGDSFQTSYFAQQIENSSVKSTFEKQSVVQNNFNKIIEMTWKAVQHSRCSQIQVGGWVGYYYR